MPTKKPRVWVTLEPEAYEVLRDMAALGGTTPGRVLSEISAPVLPALKQLVEASKAFAEWEASLHGQLAEVHAEVVSGIDMAVRALEARMTGGESAGGGTPDEPRRPADPPASAAGEAAPGRASRQRSGRPGVVSEASPGLPLTPPSNTGVILSSSQSKQLVSRGGRRRAI